jgi:hypothetical protein
MTVHFHSTDRPPSIHSREGLTSYLNRPRPTKPDVLTDKAYNALSETARLIYDRERTIFLSGGIVITTPYITQAIQQVTEAFAKNAGDNSGNHGVMLNGDGTVGKTTNLKVLMRYFYGKYRRQLPGFQPEDGVPVVFIEVPSGSTGKALMRTFSEFFGQTVGNTESMVSIRSRVVDLMHAAGTQLVVVDDLHTLAPRSPGNGESVDALKNLHDQLASTFVYAGVNLTTGPLLAGARGQQLSARYNILEMQRFNLAKADDRKNWKAIVASFENSLPLRHHEAGTLTALSDYMYERTSGSLGSLSQLITGSAAEVINNPHIAREAIDMELLESRVLDYTAETNRANALKKMRNPMSAANIVKKMSTAA